MENPYQSPGQFPTAVAVRPLDPSKIKLARLSWMLPLSCLGISIVINVSAKPLGAIGGLIFIAGVFVGFVLSVVGLLMAAKYRGVFWHAVGGLIANLFLGLAIVGMLHAISVYREVLEQQQEQQGKPALLELDRSRVGPDAVSEAILAKCSHRGNRGLAPIG